jgi:uncharacterized protein (DUF1778 family)
MAKDEAGEGQVNMTIYTTDEIRNRIKAAGALQGKSMSVFVIETMLKEMDRLGKNMQRAGALHYIAQMGEESK